MEKEGPVHLYIYKRAISGARSGNINNIRKRKRRSGIEKKKGEEEEDPITLIINIGTEQHQQEESP